MSDELDVDKGSLSCLEVSTKDIECRRSGRVMIDAEGAVLVLKHCTAGRRARDITGPSIKRELTLILEYGCIGIMS